MRAVIEKALKNGWLPGGATPVTWEWDDTDKRLRVVWNNHEELVGKWYELEQVIFDTQFARALWGEEQLWYGFPSHPKIRFEIVAWQYHLQQLAIAEDRIKYVEEQS